MRATMKPPPPMLPAEGNVTASANAVATAASTALPPDASTSAPTLLAIASSVDTMPRAERGVGAPCLYGQSAGKTGGGAGGAAGADAEATGVAGATGAVEVPPHEASEIGRASCRERV